MYALGEIVLVVIGILIAILLNQWRLESENSDTKRAVLDALQLEFESNLRQLDTVQFYIGKVPEANVRANKIMRSPDDYSDRDFTLLINDLSYTYTFNPVNGALRSAISSGEIHLIQNKRLIQLLFSWEDKVKDSDEEAVRIYQFQYESMALKAKYIRLTDEWKYAYPEMPEPIHSSDPRGFVLNEAFENFSILAYAYAREYLEELNEIQVYNDEILSLIAQELNN